MSIITNQVMFFVIHCLRTSKSFHILIGVPGCFVVSLSCNEQQMLMLARINSGKWRRLCSGFATEDEGPASSMHGPLC